MDFKPYYNNWLDIDSLFISHETYVRKIDYLTVNLNIDFFKNLKFSDKDFIKHRINAAHKAKEQLGNNPALCISGGVDSQVMLQCWLEADIKFDAFVLVFKNDLNKMDVDHARLVCNKFGVELNEIEIDIIKFLNYYNYEYALKYNSCSPHFNTHYRLFNILREYQYTGVCCGGDAPIKNMFNGKWGGNFTRNPNTFVKYVEQSKFPVIGNFISYYPNLAWTIALNTKPISLPLPEGRIMTATGVYLNENNRVLSSIDNLHKDTVNQRYLDKCEGYRNIGIDIIPQDQKYTGFENIKTLLENETGDGWEFEKRYRQPIEKILSYSFADPVFAFLDGVEEIIN